MNTEITSQLHNALWSDFVKDLEFPTTRPLLAHYTSIEVIEQIIKNNELWFSNPLYMNDLEEMRFGMNVGANHFRSNQDLADACETGEHHSKLISAFDRLFQNFDINHAIDTYVLCFSEHPQGNNDGVLSMWRGYGAKGSGVALVLDTTKLNPIEGSPLILGKVHYGTQQERANWIDNKISLIAEIIRNSPKNEDDLFLVAHYWIERLKLFSLFSKHIGFEEEKEWRVVYFSERDPSKKLANSLGYSITPTGVEPKLKLSLKSMPGIMDETASLDVLTDRIILGPSISTVLASNSIRRMLELTGKSSLASKVFASTIPYRA